MAMHIADRTGGAEHIQLDGGEPLLPFEQQPEPGPPPEHISPIEGRSNWLEQLPPLVLHPDIGHATPVWGEPLGDNALLSLPTPAVTAPPQGQPPASGPVADVSPAPSQMVRAADSDTTQEWQPDPGDRSPDFDLIAHHDRFIARGEAAWYAMTEEYRLGLENRARSGDETYANERAAEQQSVLTRAEEERSAAEGLAAQAATLDDVTVQSEAQPAASSSSADHRNGADIDSDTYNPATDANYRNGSDMASDQSGPRNGTSPPRAAAADDSDAGASDTLNPAPTQVTVTGTRLPIDAQGNQLDLRANGEALIWLHTGGVVSLGSITPELAAELSSPAVLLGSLPARLATGATAATLAEGLALVARTGAAVVEATPELGLRAIGTAGALLAFGGNIPGDKVVELGAGLRFVGPDGSTLGTVQEQQPDGSWQVVRDNASLVEVMGRYAAMTPEELGRAQAPLITTTAPQSPSGALPLPAWADRPEIIPGYMAQPATPTTTTTPSATPQWQDLLIEQSDGNADRNRNNALDRHQANPELVDPRGLAGQSGAEGVGQWGYPMTPRDTTSRSGQTGAAYQEQVSGKPYGLEINIGGTPHTTALGTPTAVGGSWFDDLRADTQVGLVAVDSKTWQGFVLPEQRFWNNTVIAEARRQLGSVDSAGLGDQVVVEWVVPNVDIKRAIDPVLANNNLTSGRIRVVVEPPRGP